MVIIPVSHEIDVFRARRACREIVKKIGFSSKDINLIEIAVSELTTNIINHASGGKISIIPLEDGIEIISEDRGMGIRDIDNLSASARKSLNGLGIGLSSLKRIMDQVRIDTRIGEGTRIIAKKWKNRTAGPVISRQKYYIPENGHMKYGIISVPVHGARVNGDAYVIKEFDDKSLIAVIDGLGHAESAHKASSKAADYIQKNYKGNLTSIIEDCHRALHLTRGAALGIVSVDTEKSKLKYAGVGNIGIRLLAGNSVSSLVSVPGVVGHRYRKLIVTEHSFNNGDLIFMYSDGISGKFDPAGFILKSKDPQRIAEDIIREFSAERDDATIIVARQR